MSENDRYRETLEEAVYQLHECENQIFTAMVNVGFSGVYEDIGKLHEPGETINLELAMFENTDDENLQKLVEVIQHIAEVKAALIADNDLNVNLEEPDDEEDDLTDDFLKTD